MLSLNEMHRMLRKQYARLAGEDGEKYAIKWLENSKWKFERVDQGIGSLSESLKSYGGKRPDFIVEANGEIVILLDAKYHSTNDCTSFSLTDCEIGKYRALEKFLKDQNTDHVFEVVFMVFPKEKDGRVFTFVSLNEFDKGESVTLASKDATKVSLLNRDDLWFDN